MPNWAKKWAVLWCRFLHHSWREVAERKGGVGLYECARCGAQVEQYKELL